MDIFKFLSDPMVILIGSNLIIFLIGWTLPEAKVRLFAKNVSKFIRIRFGKKFEDKIENVVSAFNEGLKSDNEEENKKIGE